MKRICLDFYITELQFGSSNTRVQHVLKDRIKTIRGLVKYGRSDLLRYRNMGKGAVMDVEEELGHYGLRLGMSDDDIMEYEGIKRVVPIGTGSPNFYRRRFEVAKGILFGFASQCKDLTEQDVSSAIELADVFIRKISETAIMNNESIQKQDEQSV